MFPVKVSFRRRFQGLGLLLLLCMPLTAVSDTTEVKRDPVTGFPQKSIPIESWPDGKKVAISFVFYVEVWGVGNGPNFRPDMVKRTPDLVNEYYREYGINEGVTRVAKLFAAHDAPLSIALSALFPEQRPEIWKQLRSIQPNATIVAHGMNNSTQQLPLGQGLEAQKQYIRQTLDLVEKATKTRPQGWSSPSVYANLNTYTASAAEGIKYSLDAMGSDTISSLETPSGELLMIPYPVVLVDMGQNLARTKMPHEIEKFWIDYVMQLVKEAKSDTKRPATTVAIGIHPFVVGTPGGAAMLSRVLDRFQKEELIWLTDVQAVYEHASTQ